MSRLHNPHNGMQKPAWGSAGRGASSLPPQNRPALYTPNLQIIRIKHESDLCLTGAWLEGVPTGIRVRFEVDRGRIRMESGFSTASIRTLQVKA